MERIPLPVHTDCSVNALQWACELLGEPPVALRITSLDVTYAALAISAIDDYDLPVSIDANLPDGAWVLAGATREVYSEGA